MKQTEELFAGEDGAQTVPQDPREAVPDNRLLAHLVKEVWRGLVRALQIRLADHGVSFGQWLFLRILWEREGITQRELSTEAGVMEPTTLQAMKTMEKLGYITRRQLPDSRKKIYIFLTPLGRSLQKKLVPLAEGLTRLRSATSPRVTSQRCAVCYRRSLTISPQTRLRGEPLDRSGQLIFRRKGA